VLRVPCPECGAVTEMTEFDAVIALVCDECGAGIDVEQEAGDDA
jgi:endogenous inhibitor of DNA gyrase (YacG/DUF329 family)